MHFVLASFPSLGAHWARRIERAKMQGKQYLVQPFKKEVVFRPTSPRLCKSEEEARALASKLVRESRADGAVVFEKKLSAEDFSQPRILACEGELPADTDTVPF